jgi:cell division protein YceG involved in septum cleavage
LFNEELIPLFNEKYDYFVYNEAVYYMGLINSKAKNITFLSSLTALAVVVIFLVGFSFITWTKQTVQEAAKVELVPLAPFPIGVNSITKEINENPSLEAYLMTNLSIDVSNTRQNRLASRLLSRLTKFDWYQNMASAVSRILVIYPGERKEEVVDNFGDILKWTEKEREAFSKYITDAEPALAEGKFYPGRYVVSNDATPEIVADLLDKKFTEEILLRYTDTIKKQVSLEQALTIASLLEREAYDFTDMRYISGIIWNRLFIEMPLQLDASLQYVRGSDASEAAWWPKIVPSDKFIASPYNTYKNIGLPPAPISNPSVEAVVAALNPRVTKCMFYFHDSKGAFYCTQTYEDHVTKLKEIYGRGS